MEKPFETKEVVIKKLMTDGLQIRVEMNEECINEYADIYRTWDERDDDDKLPPVTVYYDVMGDEYYLADGFHRVIAAKRAGWQKIAANVYEGTHDDALKFALKANAKNGLNRTNADMHNAAEIALARWDTLYKDEKRTTDDGLPSVRQLKKIIKASQGFCENFLAKYRGCTPCTPPSAKPIISKVTGRELVSLSEQTKNAVATKGNRHHLEERNKTVSALLNEGKDRFGVDIPEHIRPAFLSCTPSGFIQDLGALRTDLFENHKQTEDIAFAHCIDSALSYLDATIRALRNGQAFCVCRMCRGKGCGSCSNFGYQTRLQYNRVPSEYK